MLCYCYLAIKKCLCSTFLVFFNPSNEVKITPCIAEDGLLGADLSLSSCVVDLSQGAFREGICSRAVIHFSPVTDFVKDGNRTTEITVKPIITQNFLWNGYSPKPVQVNTSNY